MKNIKFLFFAGALFGFVACTGQQQPKDYTDALLVDVRTPAEFQDGSVEGAINIPVDQLEGKLETIPHDREVVVFCRSGNRSSRAKSILVQHGYTGVINGGTWQEVNSVLVGQKSKK